MLANNKRNIRKKLTAYLTTFSTIIAQRYTSDTIKKYMYNYSKSC